MDIVNYNVANGQISKSYIYVERQLKNDKYYDKWEKITEEFPFSTYNECSLLGLIAQLQDEEIVKHDDALARGENYESHVYAWRIAKKVVTTEEFSTYSIPNKVD